MPNKYTIQEILDYLTNNNILLINADLIGEVELPEIDKNFILDDDSENSIIE